MMSSKNGPEKAILYSFWRSSCSWRVRIALNLKEIPYDIKPIKPDADESPHGVPDGNQLKQDQALKIDGHILTKSVAILHYLEETRPNPNLLPEDVLKRAKVREICEVLGTGIQPLQNTIVLSNVDAGKEEEWAQHWINRGFQALEKVLSGSAGKYCVADEITMADCCLVPQVFNARRFHVDLGPYPTIVRIDSVLQNNPAFKAAHPYNQPDAPEEFKEK